jgi:hypothetical protein
MKVFNKVQTLSIVFLLVLFTGCIKKLDTDGLTLKIQESQLNKNSSKFPMKKSFLIANIEIIQPKISVKENTNKLQALVDINVSAIFLPKTQGTVVVLGTPYFNKEQASIYLKDVSIEKLDFKNKDVSESVSLSVLSTMAPILDEIFKTMPIYKIKENSFKGSFVKDVKIEDSELLVTFGL